MLVSLNTSSYNFSSPQAVSVLSNDLGGGKLFGGHLGGLTDVNRVFPVFQHLRDDEHVDIGSVLPLLVLRAERGAQRKSYCLRG